MYSYSVFIYFFNLLVPRMDLLRFSPFLHRNNFPVEYSMFPLGKYILFLFIKYFDVLVNGVLKLREKQVKITFLGLSNLCLAWVSHYKEETRASFKNLSLKKKNQSPLPFWFCYCLSIQLHWHGGTFDVCQIQRWGRWLFCKRLQ